MSTPEDAKADADDVAARVSQAVEHLATGTGDIRERLRNAASALLPIHEQTFPEPLRADFRSIITELTLREAVAKEGALEATLRQMPDTSAYRIAGLVWRLFERVQELRGYPLL